jgi:hypothetical protein
MRAGRLRTRRWPRGGRWIGERLGLALPLTVFVLTVIGLFLAGSAFTTMQEGRAALGTLAQRLSLEAAEYGAAAVLRDWDPAWNTGMPVGQTAGPWTHSLSGGARAVVRVTRTGITTWWVVSEGAAGGILARRAARRTVNAVLRLDVVPESASAMTGVPDSVRAARLAGARPVRVRDRWWSEFD